MISKFITSFTGLCFLSMALIVPGTEAMATGVGQCAANDPNACVVQQGMAPTGTAAQRAAMLVALKKDSRVIRNDGAAFILNIPASNTTRQIYKFAGAAPWVWARYNPLDATGRIDISYLVRTPNHQVQLVLKHFTPADGLAWVAWKDTTDESSCHYSQSVPSLTSTCHGTGSETYFYNGTINDGVNALNPFDNTLTSFVGNGDGQFHNINQSAFLAAVGMAQQRYKAPQSFISIATPKQVQTVTTSGSIFRQTQTTTVDTYVKPYWLLGLPIELGGPDRFTTAFCIDPSQSSDCPANLGVQAGVSFIPFNGGNMPMNSVLMDEQVNSQSGWTMFAFAVFTAVLAFTGAEALVYADASGIGGGLVFATGMSPGALGTVAGLGYAGVSAAISNTGSSPFSAQHGYLGNIGGGAGSSQATGTFGDPTHSITSNYIDPAPNNVTDIHSGAPAASTLLYRGDCPQQYTLAQCKGMGFTGNQNGLEPRVDTYVQENRTIEMSNGQMPQQTIPIAPIDPNALLNGTATLP
ncbi:MAG: hypothetical protein KGI54_04950 [Pseudomonadota bacterium]|nr:hypothetical protein [Pseudomonadota bacterium]